MHEINLFVKGQALLHPDDGDTMYCGEYSNGTREVLETVRKVYLAFKRNWKIRGKSG